MNKKKQTWDRSDFVDHLITEKKMSPKVASDIASRCLRVERVLEIDLKAATRTKQKLESLLLDISEFGMNTAETITKAHSLSATLRSAVYYFSNYMWGIKVTPHRMYFRYKK